jgi:hypothetical protein
MALVTISATRPWCCAVCGGDERVEIRVADDPHAAVAVADCPHCGALQLPAIYTTGVTTA